MSKSGHHSTIQKKIVRAVGVTTAFAVLIPAVSMQDAAGAAANTQGKATKSESVYVNLDASGKTEQEIVSDWLHDDTSGAVVVDASDLTGITNVKGRETPTREGGNLVWKLGGNDLYYQGKTSKALPVSMEIHYYLNGQEVTPSQLAGKSGRFELKISLKNNDPHTVMISGKAKTIYTPFACAVGLTLSSKTFSNVTTNFGSVLSDGNNQLMSFIGFPGLKESLDMVDWSSLNLPDGLDITADVKDFFLGPIMLAAAPVPDLDSVKNLGDLGTLADKLNQLIDAGAQLKSATGQLNSGEQAFATGVSDLLSGVTTANSSFGKIVGGASTLNSSASNSKTGLPALVNGSKSLNDGAAKLASGVSGLYGQLGENGELTKSIGALNDGIAQVLAGIDNLHSQFQNSTDSSNPTVADNADKLSAGASQYEALADGTLFAMVETNLKTLQGALTTVLGQSIKDPVTLAATVQQVMKSTVTGELTALHGAADAALLQYKAGNNDQYQYAVEYINLYDVLSVIVNDPAVNSMPDATQDEQTKKEAKYVSEMQRATGSDYNACFYSYSKDALGTTLPAAGVTDAAALAQLEGLAAQLAAGGVDLNDEAKTISGQNVVMAGTSVSAGASALATGLKTTLAQNIQMMYNTIQQQIYEQGTQALLTTAKSGDLFQGVSALNTGAASVAAGAQQLATGASGLTKLQSGISTLAGGLNLFDGGLVKIKSGASVLNVNAQKLAGGASQLNSGMDEFWTQGISKLQSVDTGKINEALAVKDELTKLAKNYQSFSGTGENISSNVKFIERTDEIKAPAATETSAAASTSNTNESLWQKIVNWVKGLFSAN